LNPVNSLHRVCIVALLLLAGCQTVPVKPPVMTGAVHWYRNAAEQRAAYVQTFEVALRQLRLLSSGQTRDSWGVILDVDETVLDNSAYQRDNPVYSDPTWDAWTAARAAMPLPGAIRFTQAVRNELGGRVVLVTNRAARACADTEANLHAAGIAYDRILCRADTSDKNPRFAAVQAGSPDAPPLEVLMWIGDNIQDFPGLSQDNPDLSPFGVRYFALPNPMYGSWERNAAR
jgi:5'-nucleotidase (lipoprotein e(P4) family)